MYASESSHLLDKLFLPHKLCPNGTNTEHFQTRGRLMSARYQFPRSVALHRAQLYHRK